jgi:hypothetical protein
MLMPDLIKSDDVEIRCAGGLLGVARDGLFEVKCRHWRCNQGDKVTFHLIDVDSGKIVETHSYKDPSNKEKK